MDRDAEAPQKRRAVPAGAGLAGKGSGQGTPLPPKTIRTGREKRPAYPAVPTCPVMPGTA